MAESQPETLVTFGIAPTQPATSYGYLELGEPLGPTARVVERFKEKPDEATAKSYFAAGPERYLWNSGMFVWRARTLLGLHTAFRTGQRRRAGPRGRGLGRRRSGGRAQRGLSDVAEGERRFRRDGARLARSRTSAWRPCRCRWSGSTSVPGRCSPRPVPATSSGNALAAQRHVLVDTRRTLVASSDPRHVIATIGCEDMIIIHTPDATLVCRADRAEDIKKVYGLVGERFGAEPRFLTLEEAAAFLRVSQEAVMCLVVQQALPGRQIEGHVEGGFFAPRWPTGCARRVGEAVLFRQAGALADDESLAELRAAIYKERSKPPRWRKS